MNSLSFRQKGVSKLEVVVVVIILGLVSGWLLHTLRFYQELTEKTVVESTIVNIRSAVHMQIADLFLQGQGDRQKKLAKTNPIPLLQQPPRGYMGEVRKVTNLSPGTWYYEQNRSELVYIPHLHGNLVVQPVAGVGKDVQGEFPVLRWQLRAAPVDETGVLALDIELLTPYEWF